MDESLILCFPSLQSEDLASQLCERLRVSAYRLSFAILGRKLEDEVDSLQGLYYSNKSKRNRVKLLVLKNNYHDCLVLRKRSAFRNVLLLVLVWMQRSFRARTLKSSQVAIAIAETKGELAFWRTVNVGRAQVLSLSRCCLEA